MDVKFVLSRAYRILRDLSRYKDCINHPDQISGVYKKTPLSGDETIIGVYENDPDDQYANVVVTNNGLYFLVDKEWVSVQYDEMLSVEPPTTKETAEGVFVRTGKGIVNIPILETDGHLIDAFTFMRFINHLLKYGKTPS